MRHYQFDDEVYPVRATERLNRFRQVTPVQPAIAVDIFGGEQRAHHGSLAPWVDRDVAPARKLQNHLRIAGGAGKRHISGNGGDANDLQFFRRTEGEKYGESIVLTGIGVDEDFTGRHASGPLFEIGDSCCIACALTSVQLTEIVSELGKRQ